MFSEYTFRASELKHKTYGYCEKRQTKYRQLYQRSLEGASDGGRRCYRYWWNNFDNNTEIIAECRRYFNSTSQVN